MPHHRLFAALCLLLVLLAGCDGPREELTPRAQAARDHRVMRLRVVKIYDNSKNDYSTEVPPISHVIEVEVLDGPDELKGQQLALPYDDYVALAPPLVGDVVTISPADWVTQKQHGKTRGFGE